MKPRTGVKSIPEVQPLPVGLPRMRRCCVAVEFPDLMLGFSGFSGTRTPRSSTRRVGPNTWGKCWIHFGHYGNKLRDGLRDDTQALRREGEVRNHLGLQEERRFIDATRLSLYTSVISLYTDGMQMAPCIPGPQPPIEITCASAAPPTPYSLST